MSLASEARGGEDCGEEPLLSSSLDGLQECGPRVARSMSFLKATI